jgi:hypothetical protein
LEIFIWQIQLVIQVEWCFYLIVIGNEALLSLQEGSQLFTISLTSPADNSVYYPNDTLIVSGTVMAQTVNSATISPFPVAYITAYTTGYSLVLGNVSAPTVNGTLGTFCLPNSLFCDRNLLFRGGATWNVGSSPRIWRRHCCIDKKCGDRGLRVYNWRNKYWLF